MASQMKAYISKLSLPGRTNNELSYTFAEQLSEHTLGSTSLFGLFFIKSTSELYHTIVKTIVKSFLDFYHRTPESIQETLAKESQIDSAEFLFENAIQYANERLREELIQLMEEEKEQLDIKKINFVLGALVDDQLFLTASGSHTNAILFYPVPQKAGGSKYVSVDILEGSDPQARESKRLFSSIVSGQISTHNSTIVLANNVFLEHTPLEKLKQIIANNQPDTLCPYFLNVLRRLNTKSDFLALFIHPRYSDPLSFSSATAPASNVSMEGLISTEKGTDNILSPALTKQLIGTIKKTIKILIRFCSFIKKHTLSTSRFVWQYLRSRNWSLVTVYAKKIPHFLLTFSRKIISFFSRSSLSRLDKNTKENTHTEKEEMKKNKNNEHYFDSLKKNLLEVYGRTLLFSKNLFQKRITTPFHSLPHPSKILLVLAVLFLTLFILGVIGVGRGQKNAAKQKAYAELLEKIQQQTDLAEASLIYENEGKAEGIIGETQTLLSSLQENYPPSLESKVLSQRLTSLTEKVFRVAPVQPSLLVSIDTLFPSPPQFINLLEGGDNEFILFTERQVFAVDKKTGILREFELKGTFQNISCGVWIEKNKLFFCDGSKGAFALLNIQKGAFQTLLLKQGFLAGTTASYNKRVYGVPVEQNQIIRYQPQGSGYSDPSIWLKNDTALVSNIRSLAIDGSVYLLSSSNEVFKFDKGTRSPFTLPPIVPPFGQLTSIKTSDKEAFLTLLDPGNRRIITIDKKTQKLARQYTSENFTDLKDILMQKGGKEMIVLNGMNLYRVSL